MEVQEQAKSVEAKTKGKPVEVDGENKKDK